MLTQHLLLLLERGWQSWKSSGKGKEKMPFELFVLADTPREGFVNQRLLPVLSAAQAVQLYKAFVEDTVTGYLTASRLLAASADVGRSRQVRVHLACYPNSTDEFFQELANKTGVLLLDQGEGERGERIFRLQRQSFNHGALAVLTADVYSPGLSQTTLAEALDAIETIGVVLGPTDRGGLYILGCLRMEGETLQDIPWETSGVMKTLRIHLFDAEQEFVELPEFWAITQPDDLVRLNRLLKLEPGRAPATARVLRALER